MLFYETEEFDWSSYFTFFFLPQRLIQIEGTHSFQILMVIPVSRDKNKSTGKSKNQIKEKKQVIELYELKELAWTHSR